MNNSKIKFLGLLPALFACTAPSFAQKKAPAWLARPQEGYNPSTHEGVLGKGANFQAAEFQAYAALARLYGMQVSSEAAASENSLSTKDGASVRLTLNDKTGITANQELFAVKTAAQYQDPKSFQCYVLVVQDKKQAVSLIEQRFAGNNKAAANYIARADASSNPFAQAALLQKAAASAESNLPFLDQIRTLTGAPYTLPAQYTPQNIKDAAAKIISSTLLSVEGDAPSLLIQKIEGEMRNLGYGISKNPAYSLKARLETSKGKEMYGLYVFDYSLQLELVDKSGARLTAPFVFKGKSQGEGEDAAKRMMALALDKNLGANFAAYFNDYLKSLAL